MSEVNNNTSTKEFINQVNFERTIENILTYTKLINDIAMKVGFDKIVSAHSWLQSWVSERLLYII